MTSPRLLLILSATLSAAGAGSAAVGAPPPAVRLSDAEIERVLAGAAARREAADVVAPRARKESHGEVGAEIGTGGHRAAYGSAFVPLGDDGGAMVSFVTSTVRDGARRR